MKLSLILIIIFFLSGCYNPGKQKNENVLGGSYDRTAFYVGNASQSEYKFEQQCFRIFWGFYGKGRQHNYSII
jgi:hypothetical protein